MAARPGSGRLPLVAAEGRGEVAGIAKAAAAPDFRHRQAALGQQAARAREPAADQVLVRRLTDGALERTQEVVLRQMRERGQLRQPQIGIHVRFHMREHAPQRGPRERDRQRERRRPCRIQPVTRKQMARDQDIELVACQRVDRAAGAADHIQRKVPSAH